jgi:hypothetical protein
MLGQGEISTEKYCTFENVDGSTTQQTNKDSEAQMLLHDTIA